MPNGVPRWTLRRIAASSSFVSGWFTLQVQSLGRSVGQVASVSSSAVLAVGMYRLHQQGWTVEQILEEMRQFGFENLPRHRNLREALIAESQAARRGTPATTRPDRP